VSRTVLRPALTVLTVLAAVALTGSSGNAAAADTASGPAAAVDVTAMAAGSAVPDSVAGWHVDPATGSVVVSVVGAGDTASAEFVARARSVAGGSVRVETGVARPHTLWSLIGGQRISQGSARCSLGVNAISSTGAPFVITAGHCVSVASGNWSGVGGLIGPVGGVSFPNNDYGTIRVSSTAAQPSWFVDRFGSLPDVIVIGHRPARLGEAVCRSGATSGWRCGTVTGLNQTVNYAGGIVYGLIRTNICAEPGDSGGPLVTAPDAGGRVYVLGILSGGSGNCSTGGTTFYQPIGEILAAYGLRLRTGS